MTLRTPPLSSTRSSYSSPRSCAPYFTHSSDHSHLLHFLAFRPRSAPQVSAAEELETASYSRRAAVFGEILALLRAMAAQQGCAAIVTCEGESFFYIPLHFTRILLTV